MMTLQASGKPIPPPLIGMGIIDTGCDVSAISPKLLAPLNLPPFLGKLTHTVAGKVGVNLFEVSLSVLASPTTSTGMLVIPYLLVIELPSAIPGIDVLIGMDVLSQCRLLVDGPAAEFFLEH